MFNQYALKQISLLLSRSQEEGGETFQLAAGESDSQPVSLTLRGFVLDVLTELCTSFQHGVCYRSKDGVLGTERCVGRGKGRRGERGREGGIERAVISRMKGGGLIKRHSIKKATNFVNQEIVFLSKLQICCIEVELLIMVIFSENEVHVNSVNETRQSKQLRVHEERLGNIFREL